jgi:hypothetical protein
MLYSLDKQAFGVRLADVVSNLGVRRGNLRKGRAWLSGKVGLWVVWEAEVVMFWVQRGYSQVCLWMFLAVLFTIEIIYLVRFSHEPAQSDVFSQYFL